MYKKYSICTYLLKDIRVCLVHMKDFFLKQNMFGMTLKRIKQYYIIFLTKMKEKLWSNFTKLIVH